MHLEQMQLAGEVEVRVEVEVDRCGMGMDWYGMAWLWVGRRSSRRY